MTEDSKEYISKKRFFDRVLTIYGRKPALEAVQTPNVKIHRLHFAETNKPAEILNQIEILSVAKGAEVCFHSRAALSRISKNSKQDQGVAVDLILPDFERFEDLNTEKLVQEKTQLIALNNITNPQNLGMIIRSVCASPIHGLLLPQKGCAKLDSLVIKASAGTIFKTKIVRCNNISNNLETLKSNGFELIGLDSHASQSLSEEDSANSKIFILGNETDGLSTEIRNLCDRMIKIPMKNDVESLNVAVTASLIAFKNVI